jgi:hypothetical protein
MVADTEVRLFELNCVGWSVCSLLHESLVDVLNARTGQSYFGLSTVREKASVGIHLVIQRYEV